MHRTRLGQLILATGWACFPLAILTGTFAPVILGTLFITLATSVRTPETTVEVEREAPERATQHEPIMWTTHARGPAGLPLFVEDAPPKGMKKLRVLERPGRGAASATTTATPPDPGLYVWRTVRVRVQESLGIAEEEMTIPLANHIRIQPDPATLALGRRVGRKAEFRSRTRRRASLDAEPEVERLRDHQPGDRFRDIDWAHSAKLDKLITRELTRNPLLPVVIMLDAGPTMRRQRHRSKLATATHAALGLASAAQAASLPIGLVAWDETGICAQERVAHGRKALHRALDELARLPSTEPRTTVPAPRPSAGNLTPTLEERAFLERAATFDKRAGRGATPLETALGALQRVASQPALVICLVDVEENPALARTLAGRLRRHGHKPIIVAFASGAHHYTRRDLDDTTLDALETWRRHRDEAYLACEGARVPFVTLGPRVDEDAIRGVIASAR